jgi:hypothetical protein
MLRTLRTAVFMFWVVWVALVGVNVVGLVLSNRVDPGPPLPSPCLMSYDFHTAILVRQWAERGGRRAPRVGVWIPRDLVPREVRMDSTRFLRTNRVSADNNTTEWFVYELCDDALEDFLALVGVDADQWWRIRSEYGPSHHKWVYEGSFGPKRPVGHIIKIWKDDDAGRLRFATASGINT